MQKRLRILTFAALVAAIVVPVGFALSLESGAPAPSDAYSGGSVVVASTAIRPTSVLAARARAGVSFLPGVVDGAVLFVAGTALLGLAAAIRKSV